MLLTPPTKRSADPDLPLCILIANPPPARPQMQAQSLHSALLATQDPSAQSCSEANARGDSGSCSPTAWTVWLHLQQSQRWCFKATRGISQIAGLCYPSPRTLQRLTAHPLQSCLWVWLHVRLLISWDGLQARGLCKGLINYKWCCLPEVDTRRCD